MKVTVTSASLVVLFCLSGCTGLVRESPSPPTISEVVATVQETLNAVAITDQNLAHALESAELTLETVGKDTGETGINLLIISVNSSVSNARTQTVYYKLTPDELAFSSQKKGDQGEFSQGLAQAIVNASYEMAKSLDGSKKLVLNQFAVTIKFTVEATGSAGAKVEIAPLEVGGKRSRTSVASHSIKLNYKPDVLEPIANKRAPMVAM